MYVCLYGISDGQCNTTTPAPNMTTAFTFYRRQGSVLSAKSNFTILDVSNLTPPQLVFFTASTFEAYRSVLTWLLDYPAADIPAPSSIVENFWSASNQLEHPYSNAILQRDFRSILVFPAWLFHANNYGNSGLLENEIKPDLPPEFYTTASLVRPFVKIKFHIVSTVIFVVFQGLALLFAWVVLFWVVFVHRDLPEISSFPLFDAEFKSETRDHDVPSGEAAWQYRDSHVLKVMNTARVRRRLRV